MYFDGKCDSRSRHLKAFAQDTVKKLQHLIDTLKHLEVCYSALSLYFCQYFASVNMWMSIC